MALDVNILKASLTAIYTATTNTDNSTTLANAICNYLIPINPASTGVESGRAQMIATFNSFAKQPNGHITSLTVALPVYAAVIASGMSPAYTGTPPPITNLPDFLSLFKSCTNAELSHAACANVIASAIHNWFCIGTATSNTDSTTINWGAPVPAIVPSGKRITVNLPVVVIEPKPKPKIIQQAKKIATAVVQKFNNVKNDIRIQDAKSCLATPLLPLPNYANTKPRNIKDKKSATVGGIKLNNIDAKNQKYIHSEYLPALAKINNISRGVKLLMTAQAIQEGFYPGARAYRTKNPGNIGNTDSGASNKQADLTTGIRLQASYIREAGDSNRKKGHHSFRKLLQHNAYSPEVKQCIPGFEMQYDGQIYQYLMIYATGARLDDAYLSWVLGFFKYNGVTINYNTRIADLDRIK